jgi:phosphate:Na+ symporter
MSFNLDLWKLLAGLGIFLFGMLLIEESVKALSGRAFRRIIRMYTNGRVRSIGSGALVTALLQSSSAVSLMVLAFVGAGVMNMQNAIGVIMGSNIGTTLTAWIIATIGFKIKIESLALPFIGLGAVGLIFFKPSTKPFMVTRLLIGFGFLFLGLDFMKGIRHNMDEFDGSDNEYLNAQYKLFRKRLVELYHNMGRILNTQDQEGQYRSLLTSFV